LSVRHGATDRGSASIADLVFGEVGEVQQLQFLAESMPGAISPNIFDKMYQLQTKR
jgi:hypothetical protein